MRLSIVNGSGVPFAISAQMRRMTAATAAVLIVTGCSESPQDAAKEAREQAGSWSATLSAAAEWWSSGEISASYFESVVTQAKTSLQTEAQSARKSGGDAAAAPIEAVAAHVQTMQDAAAHGDRDAAVRAGHAAAAAVPAEKTPPVARPQ
jgi:hypothetical protein